MTFDELIVVSRFSRKSFPVFVFRKFPPVFIGYKLTNTLDNRFQYRDHPTLISEHV